MSENKNNLKPCASFKGFGGLDLTSPIGSGRLQRLKNFKLLQDGSVIKRSGFSHFCTVDGEIRGEKVYSDRGEEVILAAIGQSLLRISVADGGVSASDVFDSDEGKISFFEYMGELYILDGFKLYRYLGGTSVERCAVYAPLYGKEWKVDTRSGVVNEPPNALGPRIRVTYYAGSSRVYFLYVGKKIKSVDALYGNGVLIPKSYYTLNADMTEIVFHEYYFSGELCAYITLADDEFRDFGLEACDECYVFDAFECSRVFAYGDNEKGKLHVTAPVSEAEMAKQNEIYGRSEPLYFPKGEAISFSAANGISAISRMYDRVLIFSEFKTWFTSSLRTSEGRERRGLLLSGATDTVGCPSSMAVSLVNGDSPVTVSHGGVYKWSVDEEFEEEVKLTRLSEAVNSCFDKDFVQNALVCRNRGENELWFADSSSEEGTLLVYNLESKLWYLYDGINAERLFEVGESIAFRKGQSYYIFRGEEGYDCFEDYERDIEALIESTEFELSSLGKLKHINRVCAACQLDGGEILLKLVSNHEIFDRVLTSSEASKTHGAAEVFDIRTRTCRVGGARFLLLAPGRSRQRVYSLDFYTS